MILGIIQARMGSSRFPGKVLKPIMGMPMIGHQLKRVNRSRLINKIVIATTTLTADDEIASYIKKMNFDCFRGHESNVLSRYYLAAQAYKATHIVRLTGDCPLIDPSIIDEVIEFHLKKQNDYSANCEQSRYSYPDGMDVEVFTFESLESAYLQASSDFDLEHVTPFIQRNNANKCGYLHYSENISHLRLTVDNKDDFRLINLIFNELLPKNDNFTLKDIQNFLTINPELLKINKHYTINYGIDEQTFDE